MTDQLTPAELRAWRKEAGMTQPEFADFIGFSKATVARWETGDDGAPWKLLALARDGWRARQNTIPVLTENDVRRIVRDEIEHISPVGHAARAAWRSGPGIVSD